jgi:hypothetical protein
MTGVPLRVGDVSVGDVANTAASDPVASPTSVRRVTLDGLAKKERPLEVIAPFETVFSAEKYGNVPDVPVTPARARPPAVKL